MAIDVGRQGDASSGLADYTFMEKANTANATGTIDHLECYSIGPGTVDFASFYVVSGSTLSTRASASGLSISGTGLQTFNAPGDFTAFNINAGDMIGLAAHTTQLKYGSSGGVGVFYSAGDRIPAVSYGFGELGSYIASVYGTGVESLAGPATLKTWGPVAKAAIKTIDGIPLANIKTWGTVA